VLFVSQPISFNPHETHKIHQREYDKKQAVGANREAKFVQSQRSQDLEEGGDARATTKGNDQLLGHCFQISDYCCLADCPTELVQGAGDNCEGKRN